MSLFKKSSMPQLDPETASRILEQTFEANEMEKNTIPLEVLASYSNYRRERFSLQRMLLIVIMLLFGDQCQNQGQEFLHRTFLLLRLRSVRAFGAPSRIRVGASRSHIKPGIGPAARRPQMQSNRKKTG